MNIKLLFLYTFLFAFSLTAVAETPEKTGIHLTVTDTSGNLIQGVNIHMETIEGTHILSANTDNTGRIDTTLPYFSQFKLTCIAKGFDTLATLVNTDLTGELTLKLILIPTSEQVAEIQINFTPDAISVKGDKTIVNVAQINPGAIATALDLLVRCPGVVVDEQNNKLSMKGKAGVMIMVDDRLQPIQGENLFNWLKNTPASMVDKIELISNPSARYDAAGNAGIINFKLLHNAQKGQNIILSSGLGQGRYGKLSEGVLYSYRKNKLAVTCQYNFALRKGFNQLDLHRDFYKDLQFTGRYVQHNYLRFPMNNHTFKTLLDWKLNPRFTAGIGVNGSGTLLNMNGKNYSTILDSASQISSFFSTINNTSEKLGNTSVNGYLRIALDTSGSNWTMDIDLARFQNLNTQLFTTEYFNSQYQKNKPDYLLGGNFNGKLNILAIKSDLLKKYRSGIQWETGVKASRVIADNDVRFSNNSSGIPVADTSKSNHFIYTENILAVYLQTAGNLKKWEYQLGIRSETTLANGVQVTTSQSFNRNYSQLFPSLSLQHPLHKKDLIGFTVSRRIERPDYEQLNPFKFYLDPTTYKAGNPALYPQLTWSAETQLILHKGAMISASLNQVNRMITEVLYPSDNDPRITVQTNKNLQSFQSILISASTPLKAGKKSNGYYSLIAGLQKFSGNIGNTPLKNGSPVVIFNGQQKYVFNNFWSADANVSFQSGQIYAYMKIKALGQLGLGVQRSLWQKKGNIKLNISDIFFTGNPHGTSDFTGYHEEFIVKRETRVLMLSFSYRIGSPQNPVQRRQGGAEEEKQRAQNKVG